MTNCHQAGVALRRLLWGLYLHRTLVLRAQRREGESKYVGNEAILHKMAECFGSGGLASRGENGKSLKAVWGQETPGIHEGSPFQHLS